MCVLRWVFSLDFWRKSRPKRSFCRLWRVSFWGSLVRSARFGDLTRNPLRRSCVSSVRNAGESAICPMRAQPSAEIVRVECAKCRRECDLFHARATLCGDRACRVREMQARVRFVRRPRNPLRRSCVSSARNAGDHWRLCSATLVRGVSVELEDENWWLGSTTLVRGAICGAGSWELATL